MQLWQMFHRGRKDKIIFMHKLLTPLFLLLCFVSYSQTKVDTLITSTDTTFTFYSVTTKIRYDTVVNVTTIYDTTKTVIVKKVTSYQRKNLIMDFTVEQSDLLAKIGSKGSYYWNGYDVASNATAYGITKTNNFARSGNYSMRVELKKTDQDAAGSKRSEARRASNDEPTLQERWYGMSFYLPTDYVADPMAELLTQWQSLKGVSPPLAIWTQNGKWYVVRHILCSSSSGVCQQTPVSLGEYQKEKWTDFVVHVKWSIKSDGLIEIWKDGVKVYTYSGINSYQDRTTGNYMKTGIYKWGWKSNPSGSNTTKRVICVDDVRIGNQYSTFRDVSP